MKFDVQISYVAYISAMRILIFINLVQNGVRLHSFMDKDSVDFKSLIR